MDTRPLWHYVTAVVAILLILNIVSWYRQWAYPKITLFSIGFLCGMLAMYIAVHLYRWK